jgi:dihydroflavonol-4-reductase
MMERVLVTGAAGCVGCQLVDELVSSGYRVAALDRPGSLLPEPLPGKLEVYPVDVTDAQALSSAAQEADVIVNLAAIVDIGLSFEDLAPVNLDAVRDLYRSAADAGSSLFVHFSTGSLYRAAEHPLREDHPLQASNDYARTKILSEDFVLSRDPSNGPTVNVIRPALIFGPRGRVLVSPIATIAPLLQRYTRRWVRLRGGPRTNFVHSRDVARAIVFLIRNRQPHGEVFNVANDDARPIGDQLSTMLEIGGMRLTGWSVSLSRSLLRCLRPAIGHDIVFRTLNRALAAMWGHVRREGDLVPDGVFPRLDRESLDFLGGDFVFDNSKLGRLGFNCMYGDLESGWRHTLQWYRDNRWIPVLSEGPGTTR